MTEPCPRARHAGRQSLDQQQRGADVDRVQAIDERGIEVAQEQPGAQGRVVDEYVHPAEGRLGRGGQSAGRPRILEI